MDEKYVAFIDILGFKNYVKSHSQEESISRIGEFSEIVYGKFLNYRVVNNRDVNNEIQGVVFSDGAVIFVKSNQKNLEKILELCLDVMKEAFQKEIMLRCGFAKGQCDDLPVRELCNLEKKLIVGEGFVNAYVTEESEKVSAIIFDKSVKDDVQNLHNKYDIKLFGEHYVLPWFDNTMAMNDIDLKKFYKLSSQAEWLEHYYNTLWCVVTPNVEECEMLIERMGKISNDKLYLKKYRKNNVDKSFRTIFRHFFEGKANIK